MGDALYRLTAAAKRYGDKEACFIESLEISKGEVLGVMGPSGAGKSTLLRLLAFLEPPTSGVVSFLGFNADVASRPPLEVRRKVTMVFPAPLLFNGTAWDNVAYGLRLRGIKAEEVERRVRAVLDNVGLLPIARVQAATLSSGEARRVALARSFVIEPEVLLLDEPTANLDPYNVALVEGLLSRINREHGTTVVLVTHSVFQARRLAHRMTLLLDGRIVEVGKTEQGFTAPRDARTAAFFGGEMVY